MKRGDFQRLPLVMPQFRHIQIMAELGRAVKKFRIQQSSRKVLAIIHGARVAYHHHLPCYLAACHRALVPSAFLEERREGNRDIMLYVTSTICNLVVAALGPRAVGATYEPHSTSN